MSRRRRIFRFILVGTAALGLLGVAAIGAIYLYIAPSLPAVSVLRDIHLQVPLRIYTRDGELMATYGTKQRVPLEYEDIPPLLIEAFMAAEDDRFFQHSGVDPSGMARAVLNLILTGDKSQGGSTITMQVARNFFLTRKKLYIRKIREIFLALQIEHKLSKEDILRLYLNKIFLGKHAYGVGAAARIYYGKNVWELSLAQMAMLAGLPQAPSTANPLDDPERALERRSYVLGRMLKLGYIGEKAYKRAMAAPISARKYTPEATVEAPYVAEMVRRYMVQHYGRAAYSAGYQVTTTLDSRLQQAAVNALQGNLKRLDRERGWRGPEAHLQLPGEADTGSLEQALFSYPPVAGMVPGLVVESGVNKARLYLRGPGLVTLDRKALAWAAKSEDSQASAILKRGDIVYVAKGDQGWQLAQIPELQGAIVSIDPYDGAIVALDGGFSFALSKFNRATEAHRQLGSSFKPFVYSAALSKGMTTATMISNAPFISVANRALNKYWRPRNAERETSGMLRFRQALVDSVNLVSVRILQQIGIQYALDWARNFGFSASSLPHNLTLALGSASLSPLAMARGYAVFANGGFLVRPYFIERIAGPNGRVLARAHPWVACADCKRPDAGVKQLISSPVAATAPGVPESAATPASVPAAVSAPAQENSVTLIGRQPRAPRLAPRTIPAQNAWIMSDILHSVIREGTGRRARALGRHDLSGKTGTTNDTTDAWFDGFGPRLVTVAWVGFDLPTTMGHGWTGAHAALPVWKSYMGAALEHVPDSPRPMPPGLVSVRIDATTGLRTGPDNPNAMWEVFRLGHVPPMQQQNQAPSLYGGDGAGP
ncbi:MAG: penicillin-binding protein 1A [Gammaproteobacteria bacterium]|nr:penicillin-binding protein 1A [Gammaproteobacteria bacterium]